MNKNNDKKYWRSLEQLHNSPDYRKQLLDDYKNINDEQKEAMTRRGFLSIMGASLALAGLAGCRKPVEKIIPYVTRPEEITPGNPEYYATNMPFGTTAFGLLVESREGRPIKIEGNPDHPFTRGRTNHWTQAEILNLYDPDRSKKVLRDGGEKTFDEFVAFWRAKFTEFSDTDGEGLAVLTESFSSMTLAKLWSGLKKQFPKARYYVYSPADNLNGRKILNRIFNKNVVPYYHFDKAKIILSLDSDFLLSEYNSLHHAIGFADGRKMRSHKDDPNRLYVVENDYTITGSMADHRLALDNNRIKQFVVLLGRELARAGLDFSGIDWTRFAPTKDIDIDARFITALTEDLKNNWKQSLIIVGRNQPPEVHALAYAINGALQNFGNTIDFYSNNSTVATNLDLENIDSDLSEDNIDTFVILGGNPAYDTPAKWQIEKHIKNADHAVHLAPYINETSNLCEWHIPESHFLESWGDTVAGDGTPGITQPLIRPLYESHSKYEVLNLLGSGRDQRGYDIIRTHWKNLISGVDFESQWRKVLHDGFLAANDKPQSRFPGNVDFNQFADQKDFVKASKDNLEASLKIDPSVLDGRYANNGWLQEWPDPVSKLSWTNAALINKNLASELNLKNGDIVNLQYNNSTIEAPVWIIPGIADYSIILPLGYGRTSAGKTGNNIGFNAYKLLPSSSRTIQGIKIQKTGRTASLANTQDHNRMEGRPIIREASLTEYRKNPNFASDMVEHPPLKSIYGSHDYSEGYQWGMVIDLNACIGCGACTIACQSENNGPIVGKEQVEKGREMHWLRVDRYFEGDDNQPSIVHMPVPCQQCEMAPCESVCPVVATVHDGEGLNAMTYNRCIGTRYCSNNCPYKVRKFNFYGYTDKYPPTMKMLQNPDVTVRSRGVMEKCTYCVQRIARAKIKAQLEGRQVRDGEIQTACQQVCPTNAIIFGNINDPDSKVSQLKKTDRLYNLLAEYNFRPRTSYLGKIRNPNPLITDEIKPAVHEKDNRKRIEKK